MSDIHTNKYSLSEFFNTPLRGSDTGIKRPDLRIYGLNFFLFDALFDALFDTLFGSACDLVSI